MRPKKQDLLDAYESLYFTYDNWESHTPFEMERSFVPTLECLKEKSAVALRIAAQLHDQHRGGHEYEYCMTAFDRLSNWYKTYSKYNANNLIQFESSRTDEDRAKSKMLSLCSTSKNIIQFQK